MNNELKQLQELQEMDKVLDRIRLDLTNLPMLIEEKRLRIQQNKDLFAEQKNKLVSLQVKKKEKEVELAAQEEKIRKHEGELNAIKSNEAYRALLNEIELIKKQKSQIEDGILSLWDEADRTGAELKKIESETKLAQQRFESEIKELETEIEKGKILLEEELKKRETFAAILSKELLNSYDYVREKKGGIAIVSIVGETCAGCNTILTQSTINEVKKGKNLVRCDSCSRILSVSESEIPASVPTSP